MQKASQILSKIINGYEIEALLYDNGVTAIFVAHKEDERVVIKVGIAEDAAVLMHREAQVLASLKHPNIIVLRDQFELNGKKSNLRQVRDYRKLNVIETESEKFICV